MAHQMFVCIRERIGCPSCFLIYLFTYSLGISYLVSLSLSLDSTQSLLLLLFAYSFFFSLCVHVYMCMCVCGCVYLCVSRVFLLVLSLEYLVISILKWQNTKGKTLVVNYIENNSNIIASIGMYVCVNQN